MSFAEMNFLRGYLTLGVLAILNYNLRDNTSEISERHLFGYVVSEQEHCAKNIGVWILGVSVDFLFYLYAFLTFYNRNGFISGSFEPGNSPPKYAFQSL